MLPDLHTDFSRGRSGSLVFLSLEEFSTVYCDPHKGFGIVNKAEIDVFLELSCFFHDPADVDNLISGSSAFSKSSLDICKFSVHVLLKPGLENFELYFASMWNECNCAVIWTFFGIAFLWNWNENFTGKLFETFNEKLIVYFSNFSKRYLRRKLFQTHFMKPALIWYQNQTTYHRKRSP